MKARFDVCGMTIEIEQPSVKDLIKEFTVVDSALRFESCGQCNSVDVFPQHRNVESDDYYEIKCRACGAVLRLGSHKEGGSLYKKRMQVDNKGKSVKDATGKGVPLPNSGWSKWTPESKD